MNPTPTNTPINTSVNTTSTALSPRREHWLLLTLAGIQFTHIVDFMVMMPLGPQLVALFGINDAQFGVLVSSYTLAGAASSLLGMAFVDRFDRKRLLLVLYVLFAAATLACALSPSYAWLLASRTAAGFFGGVLSALTHTVAADVVPFERRARATSVIMLAFSFATVAGVPGALALAAAYNWHAPFWGVAILSLVFAGVALFSMPRLNKHLQRNVSTQDNAPTQHSPEGVYRVVTRIVQNCRDVLADRNHQITLLMSCAMMFAGFSIIPFITIYTQSNVGLTAAQIPILYFVGGLATLLTGPWVGRTADRIGKDVMLRRAAYAVMPCIMVTTLLPAVPLWVVVCSSTLFFVTMNARMIPGMAVIASAANPAQRGAFMSLNSCVQSLSMGLAALVGGQIISRDPQGLVLNYWVCGLIGCAASLLLIVLSYRVKVYQNG